MIAWTLAACGGESLPDEPPCPEPGGSLHVHPNGDDDAAGTPLDPLASIGGAARRKARFCRDVADVRVASGVYSENDRVFLDGASLLGGYSDIDFRDRRPDVFSTQVLLADGFDDLGPVLDGFAFEGSVFGFGAEHTEIANNVFRAALFSVSNADFHDNEVIAEVRLTFSGSTVIGNSFRGGGDASITVGDDVMFAENTVEWTGSTAIGMPGDSTVMNNDITVDGGVAVSVGEAGAIVGNTLRGTPESTGIVVSAEADPARIEGNTAIGFGTMLVGRVADVTGNTFDGRDLTEPGQITVTASSLRDNDLFDVRVRVQSGSSLMDNRIDISYAESGGSAIIIAGESGQVSRNTISVSNTGFSNSGLIVLHAQALSANVIGNVISSQASSSVVGIRTISASTCLIANNAIDIEGRGEAIISAGDQTLVNNTLHASSDPVLIHSGTSLIANNIFGSSGGTCVSHSGNSGTPTGVHNNAFVGCSTMYRHQGTSLTTIGDVNTAIPDTPSSGNTADAPVFVSASDRHLDPTTPPSITQGGLNGIDNDWGFDDDADSATRPPSGAPWAIGAYRAPQP